MAALTLVLLIAMAVYAWLVSPLIEFGTALLQAGWLLWLPLLTLVWLLAARE